MSNTSILQVRVTSSSRIYPDEQRGVHVSTVALSIVDAVVANFSSSGAIWYYDEATSPALSPETLKASLAKVLCYYPQLAGQLQWAAYNPEKGHTHRFHRLEIVYGSASDPGVEFLAAESPLNIEQILPSASMRREHETEWETSQLPTEKLFPPTTLSLGNLKDSKGLPCMVVQMTKFTGGAVAIAVKIAHSLADAHALALFVHDWANTQRAMAASRPLPVLTPVFDPQFLDSYASGDINAPEPDKLILQSSRSLPCHRYDWWASASNCPGPNPATEVPMENLTPPLPDFEPGIQIPWSEWDLESPVSNRLMHFSRSEVDGIWAAASSTSEPYTSQKITISRHDALLAHIWMVINRARRIEDDEPVYMDLSFGLRRRLYPTLPDNFMGSPIFIAAVPSTSQSLSDVSALGDTSRVIHSTLTKFTASSLSDMLHDWAYEACPHRIWQANMGKRHLLVTSWVHTRVHEVEFVNENAPRYVHAAMPHMDGIVQVMEPCVDRKTAETAEKRKWYSNGVDVAVYLVVQHMENMLHDPLLRRYR